MSRYFFDIHDGAAFACDPIGTECEDGEAVRSEAMRALPAIACEHIPEDGDRQAFMVLVRNENHATVYTATLTFSGLWLGDSLSPERDEDFLG